MSDLLDGITERDLLIGGLLALHKSVSLLDKLMEDRARAEATAAAMKRILTELIRWKARVVPRAYGIPRWLVGIGDEPSGFARIADRLIGGELTGGWEILAGQWNDVEDFERVQADLNDLYDDLRKFRPAPRDRVTWLRTEATVVASQIEQLPGLAAAARSQGYATLRLVAEAALESADIDLREAGGRLLRLDFPVVQEGHGLLLGADVASALGRRGVSVKLPNEDAVKSVLQPVGSEVYEANFKAGLEAGQVAVLALLRRLGYEDVALVTRVEVYLRGLLPPALVRDGSAGLPFALHLLAMVADELPWPRQAASGSFGKNHRLEPMPPELVMAKLEAVLTDGIHDKLLVYSPEAPDDPRLVKLAEPTLDAAARAIWGPQWTEWIERQRSTVLKGAGLIRHWPEGLHPRAALYIDETPVVVPTEQELQLERFFLGSEFAVAMVGGPPQSGKTWIGQALEQRLCSRDDWSTLVLAVEEDIPDSEELIRAIEACRPQPRSGEHLLVIIEDVEWDGETRELEETLRQIADTCRVSVLALVRSDAQSEWRFDSGLSLPSIVGTGQLEKFAKDFMVAHPAGRNAIPILGTIRKQAQSDLWWTTRLLDLATREADAPPGYTNLLDRYYDEIIGSVQTHEGQALERLAALSLFGLWVPDWGLANRPQGNGLIDEQRLGDIGARRRRGTWWHLPNRHACEAILRRVSPGAPREDAAQPIRLYFEDAFKLRDPSVVRALEILTRADQDILHRVLGIISEEALEGWALQLGAYDLARVLRTTHDDLRSASLTKLLIQLVKMLSHQVKQLSPREMATCVDVLRQHRSALERISIKRGEDFWEKVVAAIEKGLNTVLANRAGRGRRQLLQVLERLGEDRIDALVVQEIEGFLSAAPPFDAEDYEAVLHFLRYYSRGQVEDLDCVRALALEAPIDADAHAFLAHVALKLRLGLLTGDWQDVVHDLQKPFFGALQRSTLPQIAAGLALLAQQRREFCVKLLTHTSTAEAIERHAMRSSPGEFATFLGRMLHLHSDTARDLLYRHYRTGQRQVLQPKVDLARTLARRVRDFGDAKGAGRMLKAAAPIDDLYSSASTGFAHAFATELGQPFFEKQFEGDPRTSVLYHLLEGMKLAEARFTDTIKARALASIAASLNLSFRSWPAQLALLLGETPNWGEEFAAQLAQEVGADRLLQGMTRAKRLESRTSFHELGMYLHPDTARLFCQHLGDDASPLFDLFLSDRPEVVVRAAQVMSRTLRRAGMVVPGKEILNRLPDDWPQRLARAPNVGDLAESIRGLGRLHTDLAIATIERTKPLLYKRLEKSLHAPTMAIELSDAIESVSPGVGRELVRNVATNVRKTWGSALTNLSHEQDPRLQCTAFLRLVELGFDPPLRQREAIMDQWLQRIDRISSPAAITALLRLFAAWDLERARSAAEALQLPRLVSRLQQASVPDLEWADGLLAALWALDAKQKCEPLLDALESVPDLSARMGLGRVGRLLGGLRVWRPSFSARLALACADMVRAATRYRFLLEDERHWLRIGWVAHHYVRSRDGERISILERPLTFGDHFTPAVLLWGAGWLDPHAWIVTSVEHATARLQWEGPPQSPWAAAAALTVASSWGMADELITATGGPDNWRHALAAPPYALTALLEASTVDSELAIAISPELTTARERLSAPSYRAYPGVERALALLSAG